MIKKWKNQTTLEECVTASKETEKTSKALYRLILIKKRLGLMPKSKTETK